MQPGALHWPQPGQGPHSLHRDAAGNNESRMSPTLAIPERGDITSASAGVVTTHVVMLLQTERAHDVDTNQCIGMPPCRKQPLQSLAWFDPYHTS